MKVVIIEYDKEAAELICATISRLQPDAEIVITIYSVAEGIAFFQRQPDVDIIFSDIRLGTGTSFEIFAAVKIFAPVIFCSAFDNYTLDAIKTNGNVYIAKPFTDETIQSALKKYQVLNDKLAPSFEPVETLIKLLDNKKSEGRGALLVYLKDKILPVAINDIALFFLKKKIVYLTTFDNDTYYVNKTLDDLEKISGTFFFRINRQFLINRKAVKDATNLSPRKLSVFLTIPTADAIVVSKERMPLFLDWLTVV